MSQRRPASSAGEKKSPSEPRPSASILLLSPTNEVLLLHRVQTSSSFASAHVFPGGNLDAFHDGAVPEAQSPKRHVDGPAYRLGAIRECFEETGILLATVKGAADAVSLLNVPLEERERARQEIHGNKIRFADWVGKAGGMPDIEGLIPFTRWITPITSPKRFTTQMYLYMLPPTAMTGSEATKQDMLVPTPDGGIEHTAARFDAASAWLKKADNSEIILFPPQYYLLKLVSRFCTGSGPHPGDSAAHLQAQRDRLLSFLAKTPTAESQSALQHPTSSIPWPEKVMSPYVLFMRAGDRRVVLALDKPSPELKGSGRGGDWEKVALVKFAKEGPRLVEIRDREEVLREEKAYNDEASAKI